MKRQGDREIMQSGRIPEGHTRDWLEYGSFVDERRRILYVTTPKVACSSIRTMLRTLVTKAPLRFNPLMRETSLNMLIHDRQQFPLPPLTVFSGDRLREIVSGSGWFRFCVVRDPCDRFFSVWRDKIFITEPGFEAYAPSGDQKFVEFEDFFTRVVSSEDPTTCDSHWRSQVSLLLPDDIAYTRIYNLSEVSELPSDLQRHLKAIGIDEAVPPLSTINQSWRIPADGFLTASVMATLRDFYDADFARFNFTYSERKICPAMKAANWANEFSDAVFERNRIIMEYCRHAQTTRGRKSWSKAIRTMLLRLSQRSQSNGITP